MPAIFNAPYSSRFDTEPEPSASATWNAWAIRDCDDSGGGGLSSLFGRVGQRRRRLLLAAGAAGAAGGSVIFAGGFSPLAPAPQRPPPLPSERPRRRSPLRRPFAADGLAAALGGGEALLPRRRLRLCLGSATAHLGLRDHPRLTNSASFSSSRPCVGERVAAWRSRALSSAPCLTSRRTRSSLPWCAAMAASRRRRSPRSRRPCGPRRAAPRRPPPRRPWRRAAAQRCCRGGRAPTRSRRARGGRAILTSRGAGTRAAPSRRFRVGVARRTGPWSGSAHLGLLAGARGDPERTVFRGRVGGLRWGRDGHRVAILRVWRGRARGRPSGRTDQAFEQAQLARETRIQL